MKWLIALLQVLGPILGGWHFLRWVWQPWKAFRGGDVASSWGGFYGPLAANLVVCGLWVSLTFVAPRWKQILEWIRARLPLGTDELEVANLLALIRDAFREKRDNGAIEARNLVAQLNGVSEREKTTATAIESLQLELQRILNELRGGGGTSG